MKSKSRLVCLLKPLIALSAVLVFCQLSSSSATNTSDPTPRLNEAQMDKAWIGPIVDGENRTVRPEAMIKVDDSLYFLDPDSIYQVSISSLHRSDKIVVNRFTPAGNRIEWLPIAEFNNFVYYPPRKSLVILDKSGDLFEFTLPDKRWHVFRAFKSIGSKPDPDYVDLACNGTNICLLDPERNQIWLSKPGNAPMQTSFHEVLPWRVQPGDVFVGDGIAMSIVDYPYVLKYNGNIVRYSGSKDNPEQKLIWKGIKKMRPSRMTMSNESPIYIVERENNRVLAVDKETGNTKQFTFPGKSDLRGVLAQSYGFWIIDGDKLIYRSLKAGAKPSSLFNPKRIDPRLDGLQLPIAGVRLPRHAGVFPGARRLYRFGVHKGVDFFSETGCSTHVVYGTKVMAADGGKVTRADAHFHDMSPAKYLKVEQECHKTHQSSEVNEDLFRGCQVWIDHGDGLLTRYAHLSKIRDGLKSNDFAEAGTLLGYVGVSGTGENPSGKLIHPHLHFEVWLDGKYLGWGLNPAETRGVYEDIFGVGCKR
ncbi:MAG: M23 family metallopeptidase [Candidatus Obscuribacterales bacterium]|nr:M23 family metallopeptidase [Candidatus Obscuribacterales bacterium]